MLLVSCGEVEHVEAEEYITVMYPVFMESESRDGSRGLSNMTDETQLSPFDDTGVAQGIMSTMPCMAGIKPVVIKKSQLVSSISDAFKGTVYPFGFKSIRKKIKPNDDGIYCYYDVYDREQWVGFFDYYYNWNTKRFSYKEVVNVTVSPFETVFIFIEFNDVQIEGFDTASPKFAVGQIKEDGSFERNATMTQMTFQETSAYMQSNYFTAKSDGQIFASIFRSDEGIEVGYSEGALNPDEDMHTLYNRYKVWATAHPGAGTIGDTQNFLMDDFFTVLGTEVLTNIGAIREKISNGATNVLDAGYSPAGYSSYNEYLSLSLHDGHLDECEENHVCERSHITHDNASALNFVTKETASTQFSYKLYHRMGPHNPATCLYCLNTNNQGGTPALVNVSNDRQEVESIRALHLDEPPFDSYGLMGCNAPYDMFEEIYNLNIPLVEAGDPEHDEKVMDYKIALAIRHMKACGLSDTDAENYAKNLIYAEDQIAWGNGSKHYVKITAEPFVDFKARFDAAQM
ncbi:MAG: hypothetical protein II753_06065 [Spirochaetales bacterium]|nr:hypothetical protein [Spirochaetales bacterium]